MTRALATFVIALGCLAAAPAAAQCGNQLRESDRAELVPRTVHGRAYLAHRTLGFRLIAPHLPPAGRDVVTSLDRDGGSGPLSRRWTWAAADELVDVSITCADDAAEPGFLRRFATERARASGTPTAPFERDEDGVFHAERVENGIHVLTRHRVLVAEGRTFVLSVTAAVRDLLRGRILIASAIPAMTIAARDRSRDEIRTAIRRSIVDVRFCYEGALGQRPDLAGRVTASFIMDQAGDIQRAEISDSTLQDARVEGCVLEVVRHMRFGARAEPGVVGVNYPFVFVAQP